jgi:hypothetical protein
MALFDYKFVILIGLTLVIYFIYKELETIKTRIDKMENNNKNKKPLEVENSIEKNSIEKIKEKISKIENNILLLKSDTIKKITPPNSVISSSPKINNIVIDLVPKLEVPYEDISNNTFCDNFGTVIIDNKSLSDDDTSSESDDNEPLAIYSNDNENFDENQNSLIESVKNLSNNNDIIELEFHYDLSLNNKPPLTNDILQGMKLPEIKKIAEENNIILTKKVGNNMKPKIKKELIEEILNKNIT